MRGTKGMLKRERIGVPAVTFGGWLGSNKHRDKERLRMGEEQQTADEKEAGETRP
jgi:hypothetical protein